MAQRETMHNRSKDHNFFNKSSNATHWWNTTKWVPRGGRRM